MRMAQISDENDDDELRRQIAARMKSKSAARRDLPAPSRRSSVVASALQFLAILCWALWFGGLITLFIAVQALFASRPDIAGDAASAIFIAFERYQLALAGFLLIFTALLYGLRPSWPLIAAFFLFAFTSILAFYSAFLVTPHMEILRQQYLSHTPQFARLHALSMVLFSTEAVLLLIGGAMLPHRRKP